METARTSTAWAWLETVVLTLLPVGLGLWLRREDPFWVQARFPWVTLAPLLCGLRHGFAQGLGSALLLSLGLGLDLRLRLLPADAFPAGLSVGLLLTGMLAGEFCDTWGRRLHRLAASENYSRRRLQEFTRSYHLLRASHARLERHLAGGVSLRTALERLRRLSARRGKPAEVVAAEVLDLLAEFVPISAATLYGTAPGGTRSLRVLGRLGPEARGRDTDPLARPLADPLADPLLDAVLRTGQLHRIECGGGMVQAAVPLLDSGGALRGLLSVSELPPDDSLRERLDLLALLGGHLGDLLGGEDGGGIERRVRRCLEDARHGLPGMALGLVFADSTPGSVMELVLAERRALDHAELRAGRNGNPVILMVLPLTDHQGLEGFVGRLERLLGERYGGREIGLRLHRFALGAGHDPRRLLRELQAACEIEVYGVHAA